MSLNRQEIIGIVCNEPEFNVTQNGTPILKFAVAVLRPYKGQDGERKSDFFDVVVWGKRAETHVNFAAKGKLVYVEGPNISDVWEGRDGAKRKSWTIKADTVQWLDRNKSQNRAQPSNAAPVNDEVTSLDDIGDDLDLNGLL